MQAELLIDLDIVQSNYNYLKTVTKAKVAACIKANSYGFGSNKIIPSLFMAGCRDFFVAHLEEGIEARKYLQNMDTNIYVLNGPEPETIQKFAEYNLIPSLNNLWQIKIWKESKIKAKSIIHLDTGMNRFGMRIEDFESLANIPEGVEYIISHIACDGNKNSEYNKQQLDKFIKYTSKYDIKRSLVASSGIFLGMEYHFDMVRPGGAIYGIGSSKNPNIKNPIKLTSRIININHCKDEAYVGYNSTCLVKAGSILATVPIGYADGYPRSLGNKGFMYINGQKAPIAGIVSMDLTVLNVTGLNCNIGDEVEIIGLNNTPDHIAPLIGTTAYEIITSLKCGRYNRIYRNN